MLHCWRHSGSHWSGLQAPGLAVGVSVHGRWVGLDSLKGSLPSQTILWFYDIVSSASTILRYCKYSCDRQAERASYWLLHMLKYCLEIQRKNSCQQCSDLFDRTWDVDKGSEWKVRTTSVKLQEKTFSHFAASSVLVYFGQTLLKWLQAFRLVLWLIVAKH